MTLFSKYTDVFYWNIRDRQHRFIGNQGGTSSSKTISILQVLAHIGLSEQCVINVVGQDIPNLKKGSLRDFQTTILGDMNPDFLHHFKNYNKSDRIYTLPNGTIIEFTSFSDWQDAKNGKRDYLFLNEANGIPYSIAEQLISRTRTRVYFDWNPDAEFWYHDHIKPDNRSVTYYSNYTNNPYIPDSILQDIKSWKTNNPRKYQIYGLGRTGRLEGLIYPEYDLVQDMTSTYDKEIYCLDFGYTDPMSLNHLRVNMNDLYINEIFYDSLHTVEEMMKKVNINKNITIVCDNARPESIRELQRMGYKAVPCDKGKGSIISGIESVKKYRLKITVNSQNIRSEIVNYTRKYDNKKGQFTDEPIDEHNHGMDSIRYGVSHMTNKSPKKMNYNGLV